MLTDVYPDLKKKVKPNVRDWFSFKYYTPRLYIIYSTFPTSQNREKVVVVCRGYKLLQLKTKYFWNDVRKWNIYYINTQDSSLEHNVKNTYQIN